MCDGTCPKCATAAVYALKTIGHQGGIAVSLWHTAELTYFVCTACGYSESYIVNPRSLQKIAQTGRYVRPPDGLPPSDA